MPIRSALVRYAPNESWPAHEHDELSISVVLGGHLTEQVGRTEEQAAMGSVVVKPVKSVHSNSFGPSGAVFLAIWPGATIPDELIPNSPVGWSWRHDPAGIRHWIALAGELALQDRWGVAEEAVIALLHGGQEPAYRMGEPPARLRKIRDQLHALRADRPSVAALAASLDLHPVYLTRSFRRQFGCSISAYVRRLRVRRAASILIGDAPPPIAALAQDLGFADQSHLCRTFRAETGMSPAAYRRAMGAA